MKCPKCGGKLYIEDNVNNEITGEIYRRRRCCECNDIIYTIEFEVEFDEMMAKTWGKFYRKHKNRKPSEKKQ